MAVNDAIYGILWCLLKALDSDGVEQWVFKALFGWVSIIGVEHKEVRDKLDYGWIRSAERFFYFVVPSL